MSFPAKNLPLMRRRLPLLAALAAGCLLCGCAAEAPPHPPRIQTPRPIKDLSVAQEGRALILSFTVPRLATDGRRLTKPLSAEIFRQISGQAHPPRGTHVARQAKPFATHAPAELSRIERDGRVSDAIPLAVAEYSGSIGERFAFRVVTLTRGYRGHPHASEASNEATVELLNVSRPVANLIARQAPRAIVLTWSAPRGSLAGEPLPAVAGYRVSRQSQPGGTSMIASTPSASYRDTQFQFGITYAYRVAAVFTRDGYTATSAPSAPVEITPREIFPPSPPSGLTAVYTGATVELIWKPEIDPHLAGYNVYREEPGKTGKRLNSQLLRTPAFSDHAIQQGTKYIYWVTTADAAGNESAPSTRVAVETR